MPIISVQIELGMFTVSYLITTSKELFSTYQVSAAIQSRGKVGDFFF